MNFLLLDHLNNWIVSLWISKKSWVSQAHLTAEHFFDQLSLWKMPVLAWLSSGGSRAFPLRRTVPFPSFGILKRLPLPCLPTENSPSPLKNGVRTLSIRLWWSWNVTIFAAEPLLELLWKRSPCICIRFGRGKTHLLSLRLKWIAMSAVKLLSF